MRKNGRVGVKALSLAGVHFRSDPVIVVDIFILFQNLMLFIDL